jgi:outer membrane lipoprotein carrier protein
MSRYLICLILLLVTTPLSAAEPIGLPEILAAVKKGYAAMDDLQANFSQRTYVAALKREEKGSGELFLKKRDKSAMFRFNYQKPKQQIICNGKTVWYYLPDNKQVIVTETAKLFAGGNGLAMTYLTGLGNLDEDFDVKLLNAAPDAKGNYQLELVPKKNNGAVAKLQLFISAAAVEKSAGQENGKAFFPVASSVLFDQMGTRTTIEYSRIKINSGLTNERFSFKPPPGVEVIKQ